MISIKSWMNSITDCVAITVNVILLSINMFCLRFAIAANVFVSGNGEMSPVLWFESSYAVLLSVAFR